MEIYFTYERTPELRRLATQAQRSQVHSIAWRQLHATWPRLWLRSLALVAVCSIVGALGAVAVNHWLLPATLHFPIPWGGGLGGGIGALLHIHTTATSLRPLYAEIIAGTAREFEITI